MNKKSGHPPKITAFSEAELASLRDQLRKPEGIRGKEVAALMNEGNFHINRLTIERLDLNDGNDVLEVGMGNGHFASQVINGASNIRYTGLDYSHDMVRLACEVNAGISADKLKFVHGRIDDMPFEAASFDRVFTVNTIYFWEDAVQTLEELKRVLKSGGRLIVSLRPRSLMETYPFTKIGFTMYEGDEVCQLMERVGFGDVKVELIQEPEQEIFGDLGKRTALIVSCKNVD